MPYGCFLRIGKDDTGQEVPIQPAIVRLGQACHSPNLDTVQRRNDKVRPDPIKGAQKAKEMDKAGRELRGWFRLQTIEEEHEDGIGKLYHNGATFTQRILYAEPLTEANTRTAPAKARTRTHR